MLMKTQKAHIPSTLGNYAPYRAYKLSGVEWLGDVPAHWDVVQLGRIGVFSKGSGGTKDDEVPDGIPCVRYGDLYTTHTHFISRTRSYVLPEKASAYTLINRGDVLFPTSGETIEEIGKSAVNLMNTQVLCGGDMIIFRSTIPMEPKFAGYALDCPAAQTQKSLMGRGITIMHIYSSQLRYLWLSLPPLPEQAAIVRYLDYADRRIRRYVSAKRKLIALLAEEKQAVVSRAITRGLDPSVALKPSGVEWLGDVPAHWEVVQLGRIGSFSKGGGGTKEDEVDVGLPCIRYGDIYMDHKYHVEHSRTYITPERSPNYTPMQYGDILFAGSGETIEEIGKSAVNLLDGEAYCGGDVILFRPAIEVNPRFTGYATDCVQSAHQKSCMGRGITIMHIYSSELKYMRLALPALAEQTAIVEHLDKATAGIDAAIARARRQIELVQEYRTRLISDVVTGKLDVRAAAAQLPDEAEDPSTGSGRTGLWPGGPLGDDGDGDPYDAGESLGEEPAMEREVTP